MFLSFIKMNEINENVKKESANPKKTKSSPIELVKKTLKPLANYRKQFEKEWTEFDDSYYKKQHKTGEDKKSVKNHIFKIIEGEVPILTDSMPGTQVTASREEKQKSADILNKAISYVYHDQNLQLILPTLVRSSLISAPGYLYVYYDHDTNNGDGAITFKQLDWKSVYLDGNVQDIDKSSAAVIKSKIRKDELISQWPEFEDKIMALEGESESGGRENNFESRDVSGSVGDEEGAPSEFKSDDLLEYTETWIRSFDLEEIPEEETLEELEKERGQIEKTEAPDINKWENHNAHYQDHLAQRSEILEAIGIAGNSSYKEVELGIEKLLELAPDAQDKFINILLIIKIIDNHLEEHEEFKKLNPQGKRRKYKDGWRLIKSCKDVILYDGGNPDNNGMIPLIPFYCYKDKTIYGFGEIKNIIDLQRTLNDVDFREFENLKVSSNTGWISDVEAEVKGKLHNEPGIHVEKKRGTDVRRLEGVTVSPQLANRRRSDQIDMGEISGLNEATQGDMPSAGASGAAIQKLQTQAIGRIRLKDRVIQHFSMRRLGLLTASLIIKYWTNEKKLRLRNNTTDIEEFTFNPMDMADLEYSVEISPGSMAGIDKDALNGFYKLLLDGQHITFEEFLLVADFPKKEILLKKLQEKNQQAQAQQESDLKIQDLQTTLIKLKGRLLPETLSSEEKKIFDEMARQEILERALNAPNELGNMAPDNGQANNQGNING